MTHKDTAIQRSNIVTGSGTPGRNLSRGTALEVNALGYASILAGADGTDHNRATAASFPPLALSGVANLALPDDQITSTYGYLGDPARVTGAASHWWGRMIAGNNLHLATVRANDLTAPFAVHIYGYSGSHKVIAEAELRDRHVRLPDETTLAVAVLPHEMAQLDNVRADPWLANRLRADGCIETHILVSNTSPPALAWGRPKVDELVSKTLAGLMTSVWMFPNMRGPADVAHVLGRYSSFAGMSFGMGLLLPLRESPQWYSWYRQHAGAPIRGTVGHPEDIIIATTEAAKIAILNPAARTVTDAPNPAYPAYLVIREPLRHERESDTTIWRTVVAEVEHWIEVTYPWITCLWVAGEGAVNPDEQGAPGYPMQVGLLYPLPDHPETILQILEPSKAHDLPVEPRLYQDVTASPRAASSSHPARALPVRRTHRYRLLKGATR